MSFVGQLIGFSLRQVVGVFAGDGRSLRFASSKVSKASVKIDMFEIICHNRRELLQWSSLVGAQGNACP